MTMQRLGINYGELLVCQPDHGEQAFNVMDELVRSGTVDLIVVDSVSAMVPRSEVEGDIGTPQVGMWGPAPACCISTCGRPELLACGMQLRVLAWHADATGHVCVLLNVVPSPHLLRLWWHLVCLVQIGSQARLMSVALRKLANHANKCGCTIMFINQLRYKVMHRAEFSQQPAVLLSDGQFGDRCLKH